MNDGHPSGSQYGLYTVLRDHRREQTWATWASQAQNFARRDNFVDAVARMRRLCEDVKDALAHAQDAAQRSDLASRLKWAEYELQQLERQEREWREAIAKRRAEQIAGAELDAARPLPSPPPGRS